MMKELVYCIIRGIARKPLTSIILKNMRNGEAVLTKDKDGIILRSKYTLNHNSFLTRNREETISIVVPGGYNSIHGIAIRRGGLNYEYAILKMSRSAYNEVKYYFERLKQKSRLNV